MSTSIATVPDPLPPRGLQVIYTDALGAEGPGWITVPYVDYGFGDGPQSIVLFCSENGFNHTAIDYADPAVPNSWRYDPRHPPDAFPADLVALVAALTVRVEALEAAL